MLEDKNKMFEGEEIKIKKKKDRGKLINRTIGTGIGIVSIFIVIVFGLIIYVLVIVAGSRAEKNIESLSVVEKYEKKSENLPESEDLDYLIGGDYEDLDAIRGVLGDNLQDSQVSIRPNKVEVFDKIKDRYPGEYYQFFKIGMDVENISSEDVTIYTDDFKIRDLSDNIYYVVYFEEEAVDNLISAWQYLPKDERISGSVILEVKKDAEGLQLEYDGTKKLIYSL